jgi:hypothetical protein
MIKEFLIYPDNPETRQKVEEFKDKHRIICIEHFVLASSKGPLMLLLFDYKNKFDDDEWDKGELL